MEIAGGEHTRHLDEDMQEEIRDNEFDSVVTTNIVMNLDEYSEFGVNLYEAIEKFS